MSMSGFLSKFKVYQFGSEDAEQLASFIKERLTTKDPNYIELSDDDVERIRLIGLLLSKIGAETVRTSGVQGEEWKRIGDVYGKLKILLEHLELNRIINQVNWSIGGGCFFIVVDRRKFQQFLYAEIRGVPNRMKGIDVGGRKTPPTERDEEALAHAVISRISICNQTFRVKRKATLFREDMEIASEFIKECESQDNFRIKIGVLATLFEVDREPLRRLVTNPDPNWRSLTLIKRWATQEAVSLPPEVLEVWEKIILIRDKTQPYHPTGEELIGAYRYFGQDTLQCNSPKLWREIMRRFTNSLYIFSNALDDLTT